MIRASLIAGLAGAIAGLGLAGAALAQRDVRSPAPVPAADYSKPDNWLCLPGRADACRVDQSATVVSASGSTRLEEFDLPRKDPAIDCFYVYPTVSNDPGDLSDLIPGPEERSVAAAQFARFASVCRPFAPMYRQVTLAALRTTMAVRPPGAPPLPMNVQPAGPGGGYNDVLNAWTYYLAHENKGRPIVLIGHSQGSFVLTRLIQQEIEGKAIQKQLVSAILIGGEVKVAPGKDVGGSFKTIPLCRFDRQTGCIIAYSSFRDTLPPPPNALFGRDNAGLQTACTNPANLKTGKGEPDSYFAAARASDFDGKPQGWVVPFKPIGTPFVKAPGFVATACVTQGGATYLSVHVNADSRDPRTDTLSGDVMAGAQPNAQWGLHLIDMNLSMGDLVDLVDREGRAWKPGR